MEYLGYLASILIGISLGLIGSGGSILTMPILVYLFSVHPKQATTYSLFIVGITALFGGYRHYKMGNFSLKPALYFAVPSVISVSITRKIFSKINTTFTIDSHIISLDFLIMFLFSILMIVSAILMIRKKKSEPELKPATINYTRLGIIGFIVGIVTGFFGMGGGFLIIPALLFFADLPMKQAVGTSLFIIFLKSLGGFVVDLVVDLFNRNTSHIDYSLSQIDYPLLLGVSAMALIGMLIGSQLSKKMDGSKLKPLFGWFILIMGFYIIINEVFFNGKI